MRYPTKTFRIPDELKAFPNGRIPDKFLRTGGYGTLYHVAAWWAGVMMAEAKKDGITITPISGGYRSYDRQYALFMERYSMTDEGRKPQVTRIWNQKKWFLRKGFAPCATPGYSNHGWGCAQDWSVSKPEQLEWLRKNAPKYGWFWESQPTLSNGKPNPEWEPWHLNWIGA